MDSVPVGMKQCSKCGEVKEATLKFFGKQTCANSGFRSACRICCNVQYNLKTDIKRRARKAQRYYDAVKFGRAFKTCYGCKVSKPATSEFFYSNSRRQYGLDSLCIVCDKVRTKAYNQANAEKVKAREKAYRDANPEREKARCKAYREANAESCKETIRVWAKANPTKVAATQRRHRLKHLEKVKAKEKAYREANPEKGSAERQRRRARIAGAEGTHTAVDIAKQFEAQKGKCHWCKTKLIKSGLNRFHVDHIYPLAKGGSNGPENICCACPECNLSKGAKSPLEFAGRLF